MTVEKYQCYAPVFKPNHWWACIWLTIIYTMVIVLLTIMLIIAVLAGPEAMRKIACQIKQYVYMIRNCRRGNSDTNLVI
ncbi:MAG: hypothetical protein ACXAD7_22650 [Candidatus Kariarchaeaceae archaeon]|jgi:ABC-type sugar transport system permease subunit